VHCAPGLACASDFLSVLASCAGLGRDLIPIAIFVLTDSLASSVKKTVIEKYKLICEIYPQKYFDHNHTITCNCAIPIVFLLVAIKVTLTELDSSASGFNQPIALKKLSKRQ